MSKNVINTIILIILVLGSSLYSDDIFKKDIAHLESLSVHANQLVRENNLDGSLYFYNSIIAYIDSVEAAHTKTSPKFNTIKSDIFEHYDNLKDLVDKIDYNSNEEKVFHLDKSDLGLNNKEKIEYAPFPHKELKLVKYFLDIYNGKRRNSAQIYLNRAARYVDDVKKVFEAFGLPEELAYVPMAESGYVPFSHSYAKAAGLWQFIPSTGKHFGLSINWWEDERKDVIKSTIAAAKFYKVLYKRFEDWNLVLAAYNCGEGGVNRRIRKHKSKNFWRLSTLPKQTREYVPKLRALIKIGMEPEKYGFAYKSEKAFYDTVHLDSCISLKVIADLANLTYEEIKKHNPQLRQWCLPPYSKNYPVVMPAMSKVGFREKFNKVSEDKLYTIEEYTIKKDDSIKKIANSYKIKEEGIKNLNNVSTDKDLVVGEKIKIVVPPLKEKWFTDFNQRYLSYYDDEKYYLDGRKQIRYRVKSGDSVWGISRKFKVNHKKLKAWNKIGKRNLIKPGQNLVIYL
ncbi:MAG: LysM peptidoglycan-binding domain-containing protein [Candidatus Delongbacteria bacterium]|nr:LysM peptidoglycan-binding domain-containing protein [Candidatus Delongbacteria bacterium]